MRAPGLRAGGDLSCPLLRERPCAGRPRANSGQHRKLAAIIGSARADCKPIGGRNARAATEPRLSWPAGNLRQRTQDFAQVPAQFQGVAAPRLPAQGRCDLVQQPGGRRRRQVPLGVLAQAQFPDAAPQARLGLEVLPPSFRGHELGVRRRGDGKARAGMLERMHEVSVHPAADQCAIRRHSPLGAFR